MKKPFEYLKNGCGLIAQERERQIRELNRTAEADDELRGEELRDAAIAYAIVCDDRADNPPSCWPFDPETFHCSPSKTENLVKSGALIAAEIDRYHREFKNACNGITKELFGFECFDEMDVYDLERETWVGVEPSDFVRRNFESDYERMLNERGGKESNGN